MVRRKKTKVDQLKALETQPQPLPASETQSQKRGRGRPVGAKTKPGPYTHCSVRLNVKKFVETNSQRLTPLFEAVIEQDGPKAALGLFLDVLEYYMPKLARMEYKGEVNHTMQVFTPDHLRAIADAQEGKIDDIDGEVIDG